MQVVRWVWDIEEWRVECDGIVVDVCRVRKFETFFSSAMVSKNIMQRGF